MDTSGFSMGFSPAELGITKIVGDRLLPKPEEGKYIWAELFGLNVCGMS
jgi:ribosomal 30S subunit maturation factor RimM